MPQLRSEMLPPNINCPHCHANMDLDEQERVVKKFICPGCGKAIDLTEKGSTKDKDSQPFGNRDNAPPTMGDPNLDAKDFFKTVPPVVSPRGSTKDLYESGMDYILASSALFALPFQMTAENLSRDLGVVLQEDAKAILESEPAVRHVDDFLANVFTFTYATIETVSLRLADVIRQATINTMLRSRTSDSVAGLVKSEAFRELQIQLQAYSNIIVELGVQLQSISTIDSAVRGAFVGGGIQLLASNLGSSRAGTLVGGLMGAMWAEQEKQKLRHQLLTKAFEGADAILSSYEKIVPVLMDQFATYVFANEIDFVKRDDQINRGQPIVREMMQYSRIAIRCLAQYSEAYPLFAIRAMYKMAVSLFALQKLSKEGKRRYNEINKMARINKEYTIGFMKSKMKSLSTDLARAKGDIDSILPRFTGLCRSSLPPQDES